jgi:MoxR-like ATPase
MPATAAPPAVPDQEAIVKASSWVAPLRTEIARVLVGQTASGGSPARGPADQRPRAARRRSRSGQDARRAHAGGHAACQVPAHPVHARPSAGGCHRHHGVSSEGRHLHPAPRAHLCQSGAGGRNQPRSGQGAKRPARGHAGAAGHHRREHPTSCPTPSWCSPRRTPSTKKAPTRCQKPSSTASCSKSASPTRHPVEERQVLDAMATSAPKLDVNQVTDVADIIASRQWW